MKYRREIDGLRAVAVLAVILFHAGFEFFKGGFVGVDIFFVISGYLITSIIISEMYRGEFSLIHFYYRRARRILPALFFVILCCIPFAWLWFLPIHLKEFSESIVSTTLFSSNIYFWREINYFSHSVDLKPLIHTWSLAVEEQYYLIFPLFIMAVWRFQKRWIAILVLLISLLSLFLAHWGSINHPEATFFLLPTRVWELSIGVLVALYFNKKSDMSDLLTSNKIFNELFGFIGLALICYSIIIFDKTIPFPSLYALVPTIGAALIIIFSSTDTFIGRFLSLKGFVGIGIISYSAYLWHQPLLAFGRYRIIGEAGNIQLFILSLASLFIAYLSWRFIETPFRDINRIGKRNVYIFAISITIILGVFGFFSSKYIKLPVENNFTAGRCNTNSGDCYRLSDSDYSIALWGDSYADSFAKQLGSTLNSSDITLNLYIKLSCPSIWPSFRNADKQLGVNFSKECDQHNRDSFNEIIMNKPKYVVLSNAYEWYLNGLDIDGGYLLANINDKTLSPTAFIPNNLKELFIIFNSHNITPIILTPHPRVNDFFEKYKKHKYGISLDIPSDYIKAKKARNTLLSQLSLFSINYHEVNGLELFCKKEDSDCSIVDKDNNLILFDGSHFSYSVSSMVTKKIIHIIANDVSN